ncbi:ATP-binding protein [Actinoallomurus spadix]|uniref:Histidine kinase/HSP90-like ATPase domain-containing protein n=1 Tax=Actinoallomurus spadix TaxID=79912 RepID=A0ABP3FGE3_9ACTN|nr:ATP-binding protein [Actinoallomurus spadix]MCO5990761.1 ATP-binding protein [Actinoallomurus spadix]
MDAMVRPIETVMDDGDRKTVVTLRPVPQAADIARTFIEHRMLVEGRPDLVDDATLIASEFITNAYVHVPAAEFFKLMLCWNAGSPLIEVWDPSWALPRPRTLADGDGFLLSTSGKGLFIVSRLAQSWGSRRIPKMKGGGKIVWARLPKNEEE